MPTEPLKPCPWCGDRAQIDRPTGSAECCRVACEGANSILVPAEWNDRPIEDALSGALTELCDFLGDEANPLIANARVAIARARGVEVGK